MNEPLWKQRDRLDWLEAQQRQSGATRLLQWSLAIAIAVLVAAVLVGTARGEVPAQLIPGKFAPAWMIYRPAGFQDGNILQDVTSRCTPQQRSTAYEADRVTYTHEALHQLHSRIRNAMGGTEKVNAVYVGGGRCLVLNEPRVKLSTVASYVPGQYRNHLYSLYLVQQARDWSDCPLYVLDEGAAYMAGTQAAIQLGVDPHGSDQFMLHFNHFIDALLVAVDKHDPNYEQRDELRAYAAWHKQRTQEIYKQLHK